MSLNILTDMVDFVWIWTKKLCMKIIRKVNFILYKDKVSPGKTTVHRYWEKSAAMMSQGLVIEHWFLQNAHEWKTVVQPETQFNYHS